MIPQVLLRSMLPEMRRRFQMLEMIRQGFKVGMTPESRFQKDILKYLNAFEGRNFLLLRPDPIHPTK
jgi:hypothetical protein